MNVKKSLMCFWCGLKGPFKRDCPKQKGNGKQDQIHDAKVATDTTEQEEAFHATIAQLGTGKWLIDSGASESPVGLGDGYPVEALGKVWMTMLLGNCQDISRVMQNVLNAPELTTSLFSVRAVTNKGYRVHFEDEECRIETKQRGPLGKGIVGGKLFKLGCNPRGSQTAAITYGTVTDVDLWHQRLRQIFHPQV